MSSHYVKTDARMIPSQVRFDVDRRTAGQMVTREFGTFGAGEAGQGDAFMRVSDASDGTVRYYRIAHDMPRRAIVGLDDDGLVTSVDFGGEYGLDEEVYRHFNALRPDSDPRRLVDIDDMGDDPADYIGADHSRYQFV